MLIYRAYEQLTPFYDNVSGTNKEESSQFAHHNYIVHIFQNHKLFLGRGQYIIHLMKGIIFLYPLMYVFSEIYVNLKICLQPILFLNSIFVGETQQFFLIFLFFLKIIISLSYLNR